MVLPSRALAVALCVAVAFGQGFGQVRVDDENMEQPDLLDMASFLELNGQAPPASSLPQRPQQDLEQAPPARFQRQGQAQKLERGFKHKDNPKATADSRGDPWWAYMDAAAPPEWLVPPWADAPGMSDMPKMAKPRPIAPPPPPPEGMGRYYPPPPPPPPSPPPPLPPPPPAPSLGFATPKAPAFAPGGYAQPLLHYGPQGALKHATPTFSYGNMAAAPTYSNMGALHQVAPHLQFQPLHPSVAAPGYASGAAQPGAGYAPMGFNSGSQQVAMPVSRPDSIYPKMAVDQKAQGHDNIFPTHQTGPKAYLDQLSFGGAQVLDAAFAGSGSGSSKSKKLI